MKLIILMFILTHLLIIPVNAASLIPPEVPTEGADIMPEDTSVFGAGLWELLQNVIRTLDPDLREACRVSMSVIAAVMIVSALQGLSGPIRSVADQAGTVTLASVMLSSAHSLIRLGAQTITELGEYGKLLLPVMTAAMAAQGGVTSSAALYTGTAVFDAVLSSLITKVLLPMIYLFLALAAANGALGEPLLKNMRDMLKGSISWCLKTILTAFTTYMGITGVISGTTDAATLKATKVTISSVVPVVGSILSDASEAVLVSAGIAKNAAGIYGILAILALFLGPFLKIGVHYLILKLTAAICNLFGSKQMTELISDFSSAMGLILAMTGSVCLLLLISTVCFLKGVG